MYMNKMVEYRLWRCELMSVVLAICMETGVIMMCDGRKVKFNSQSKDDFTIADENCKKLIRVNKEVCIGITGDANILDEIVYELQHYDDTNLKLEKIEKIVLQIIKDKTVEWIGCKALIGGKNRKGKFVLHIIDYSNINKENYKPVIFEPIGNLSVVQGAFPKAKNVSFYESLIEKHISNTAPWGNTDILLRHMAECIAEIAQDDMSVNTNLFTESIGE